MGIEIEVLILISTFLLITMQMMTAFLEVIVVLMEVVVAVTVIY